MSHSSISQKTIAIAVHNVTKHYSAGGFFPKKKQVLDQINLQVNTGEVFGFLGPNGAGKTSLIKIIVGIMNADKGFCEISGFDSRTKQAKLKLGYLPERPYFHDFLTSEEFLKFHGRLVGMKEKEILHRIPSLLKKVGLTKARDQKLKTFSKGMLQRIGFAQALLHDPDVLILDEPMSGLDPVGRREVRDIITEISEQGKTIFFSTHIIHDVEVICTTVGFINHGVLKGSGNIDSLLGKTIRSMEIRFSLPEAEISKIKELKPEKQIMEGWVIDLESSPENLESEVNEVLEKILKHKGAIRSVVPRKLTLEDLYFGGPA